MNTEGMYRGIHGEEKIRFAPQIVMNGGCNASRWRDYPGRTIPIGVQRLIIAAILILTATMAAAEPNVTLYQLQNNCEKLADETFRRVSADDEDRVHYRAHYNAHLNKCLYAETYISPTPAGINMWVYLSDLRENRIYGGFHRSTNIGLFYCNLEDKECHSEAEWNEIVKQYMEE
jgi:hypothetical protein